jgi:hypothetical protein
LPQAATLSALPLLPINDKTSGCYCEEAALPRSAVGRDEALKKFSITELDKQLVSTLREGRWGAFLRVWLTSVVVTAAVGFIAPLILIGLVVVVTSLFGGEGAKWAPNLLDICMGIAAMAGGAVLIFTAPIAFAKAFGEAVDRGRQRAEPESQGYRGTGARAGAGA